MHHPDHSGHGCPKCSINIRMIAPLAKLLGEPASGLAAVAEAAVGVLDARGLHPKPNTQPCEHASKLMSWISGDEEPDSGLMGEWTEEIFADIAELVG